MTETTIIEIPSLEENFYLEIETLVKKANTSYIDGIIHWCESRSIEIEYIAPLITKNLALRAKLQCEGEDLHFLKKIARLPI